MQRAEFLRSLWASGMALGLPGCLSCNRKDQGLDILVLGGTCFVGPAIVNAALSRGHRVTLFNRGITNPGLFESLELIKGDREKGIGTYEPLKKKRWDVVIDVWPERSILVEEATRALEEHASHYAFISSIAAYKDFEEVGLNEESELVDLFPDTTQWGYSEEKVAAEQHVRRRFPGKHSIVRPCPIKGWRDPALDLYYWCHKLMEDETILAPGSGEDPIQFIDVKDVGRCCILAVEKGWDGVYNCVGPGPGTLLWKDFLSQTAKHLRSKAGLVWAPDRFLRENGVGSMSDLPLWAPLSEDRGFAQISNMKLLEHGFEFTPMEQTLDDCIRWNTQYRKNLPAFGTPEAGYGREKTRELALIEKLTS